MFLILTLERLILTGNRIPKARMNPIKKADVDEENRDAKENLDVKENLEAKENLDARVN